MDAETEKGHFYAAALHKSILLVAATLFYASLSLSRIPAGLNSQSLALVSLLLWPILAVLFIIYSLQVYKAKHRSLPFKPGTLDIRDLTLALLPMTPILRYILTNQDILSINESISIFCLFFLATLVSAYFIPILLSLLWSHLVEFTILGLSFSFSLFFSPYLSSCHYFYQTLLMPLSLVVMLLICCGIYIFDRKLLRLILYSIILLSLSYFLFLSPYISSSYYSNKILLLPFSLAMTFIICYGLYIVDRKALRLMVTVLFLTNLLNTGLFEKTRQAGDQAGNKTSIIQTLGQSRQMIAKPDIFLLTYESYVGNETMGTYGIDNSDQESYLTQNGFKLYSGTYSIGPNTKLSMNAVLDITSDAKAAREATSGNGIVQRLLQQHGYETYGIFSNNNFFWGQSFNYDHCYPNAIISEQASASSVLVMSILQGEFQFWAGFNRFDYTTYLSQKRDVLTSPKREKPRLVYTHNNYPGHGRYIGMKIDGDEIDTYKLGLKKANEEMKNDLEALIKFNPDSIIIINGDHGPHLTLYVKDINNIGRMNIQDRYGSFLAIRWPESLQVNDKAIAVLQDIFPVIFSALFNTEEFIDTKVEPKTLHPEAIAGAIVNNGIIIGGKDDGKTLYESSRLSPKPSSRQVLSDTE